MPLVTVGIPCRNGAKTLARAVGSVTAQTYRNLEIIISDNASSDDTQQIAQRMAAEDPRIRVYRQVRPMTAVGNFRWVFERAKGEFFMWAADDDLRTENYVEVLTRGLLEEQYAVLAFSDVAVFGERDGDPRYSLEIARPMRHEFVMHGQSVFEKLEHQSYIFPLHIYGLIRSSALHAYRWYECEYGPDWAIIAHLVCTGQFIYREKATFYYYYPRPRTTREMALANSLRPQRPLFRERIAWKCASAASEALRKQGQNVNRWWLAMAFYRWQNRGWKNLLQTRFPWAAGARNIIGGH